jgi:5-methylcytosine-specific restriction endonuclease McrA
MKKINLNIDDQSILDNLYTSSSNLVTDFQCREDHFLKIRYRQYLAYANKHKLYTLPETSNMHTSRKETFKKLYLSKIVALNYIRKYREETSYKICSLCGSPSAGTLDHFLPQDKYSEFSIFSKNLIPACKCNSSKNKKISMMYHPQFFNFLGNRLYIIKFEIFNNCINFHSIQPTIKSNHKYYQLINSHLVNHILKCVKGFKNEMRTRLQSLYDTPHMHIFALDSVKITSKNQLKKIILQQLKRENEKFQTPNSWDSIILASFLQDNIFSILFDRIRIIQQ